MSILATIAANLFLAVVAPIGGGTQPPAPPPVEQEQAPLQGPLPDGRTLDQIGPRK